MRNYPYATQRTETEPTMPPLKSYIVQHSNQEILDKVGASISSRRTKPVSLNLKAADGTTRTVDFHIDGTGHDKLGDLITGVKTDDKKSIDIHIPSDDSESTALFHS